MAFKIVRDDIYNRVIYSKAPEKTVAWLLGLHNHTYPKFEGIHYPENAIAIEEGDVIVIRRRK